MKSVIGSSLVAFLFVGCGPTYVTVCPTFPEPDQYVLDKIESLHDRQVDEWLEGLYKLNKKLKLYEEK